MNNYRQKPVKLLERRARNAAMYPRIINQKNNAVYMIQQQPGKVLIPAPYKRVIGGNFGSYGAVVVRGPMDFNPALLAGLRGNPGIKVRLNQRAFQYASELAAMIINREVVRAEIPDINQKLNELSIEISICNLYISHYRPPECVEIRPMEPNYLVIKIENFDIRVTGNLDGVFLSLFSLYGIIHATFYHLLIFKVSITLTLSLAPSPTGSLQVEVCDCDVQIPLADVCIQCGGFIGDIANLFFRDRISEAVRTMLPGQICQMVPDLLTQRLNPQLARIPQYIPFSQISSFAMSSFGPRVPAYCYSPQCQPRREPLAATNGNGAFPSSYPPRAFVASNKAIMINKPVAISRTASKLNFRGRFDALSNTNGNLRVLTQRQQNVIPAHNTATKNVNARQTASLTRSKRELIRGITISASANTFSTNPKHLERSSQSKIPLGTVLRRDSSLRKLPVLGTRNGSTLHKMPVVVHASTIYGNNMQAVNAIGGSAAPNGGSICPGCPNIASDPFGGIRNSLLQQINFNKLADVILTTQIIQTYATPYDFTLCLNGEFSPRGYGGTPFGAFPMMWPTPIGSQMLEAMISDFTINSLLYWMHKKNFLIFRLGQEIPGIESLLVTTCDEGEDDLDEEFQNEMLFIRLARLSERRRRRRLLRRLHYQQRNKRQTGSADSGLNLLSSLSDLSDLGICLGDILPAVKEEYPNRTLAVYFRSARAPSLMILSGGNLQIDILAFIEFYLDRSSTRVGIITAQIISNIMVHIWGNKIYGNATLPVLKLQDREGTLGLQQDSLDNLASLFKEVALKALNEQLNKGISLPLSLSNLPLNIVNPQFRVLNHAIYIGTDFTVSPSLLS
ncbi:unnamed protein product [Thelazia callipaeda]|uniref:BPI1 domain-containing protein n=1 Tax=Thelazia callipaeda TaxID=103827 RepID=A0A0N5CNH2_THECL|nr:unnamed protein product [Thelazia callipaeda]